MAERFSDVRVCVFDAYGTLFDVHSAAAKHSAALGPLEQKLSEMWRAKQLQYTWLRSLMGNYEDFQKVTEDALGYVFSTLDLDDPVLFANLMNSYLTLECFEEVADVLKKLKDNGFLTAILSNGSPDMLDPVVESSGVAEYIDISLSVDDIGIFKPSPHVYQLPCDYFGVEASQISFQSSNCWDAIGAAHFGYRVAWCNRYKQEMDRLSVQVDAEISDLTELLPLLGVE